MSRQQVIWFEELSVNDIPRVGAALLHAEQGRRFNVRAVGTPNVGPGLRQGLEALEHSAVARLAQWLVNERLVKGADPLDTLTAAVEDRLAQALGLEPGELLLDYPAKTQRLGLDIPVLRRGGGVHRLTAEGWDGAINLPKLSEELYRSARWMRVFSWSGCSGSSSTMIAMVSASACDSMSWSRASCSRSDSLARPGTNRKVEDLSDARRFQPR